MPHLPGNIAQRLAELRYQRGLTQEQLSKEMYASGLGYYDRSTISRAESGGVTNVSSELVMALSKYFDVTADFLLGLTDIPDKKNYELSELGLSYEAARKLLFREVDPDALNRFIECGSFAELTERIADFYHSSMTETYAKVDSLFRGIRDDRRLYCSLHVDAENRIAEPEIVRDDDGNTFLPVWVHPVPDAS